MPKMALKVDGNYRRFATKASGIRSTLRQNVHPPERRATTRTLFLIGALAIALIGGGALGLLN